MRKENKIIVKLTEWTVFCDGHNHYSKNNKTSNIGFVIGCNCGEKPSVIYPENKIASNYLNHSGYLGD